MKVIEIGSGTRPRPGAFHVEVDPNLPEINLVAEMDNLVGVGSDSYDELWATHVIEHVPLTRARKSLAEWRRVLVPGGMAHIDTPNLKRNAALYAKDDDEWKRDFDILTRAEQDRLRINGVPSKTLWFIFKTFSSEFQWDVHYWNADAALLTALCLEAGFTRVETHQTEPSLIVRAWK